MYLTFSNLNSIHWLIKKNDIGLNVLFRTFSGHFMTFFRTFHDNFQVKLFPPKITFFFLILNIR